MFAVRLPAVMTVITIAAEVVVDMTTTIGPAVLLAMTTVESATMDATLVTTMARPVALTATLREDARTVITVEMIGVEDIMIESLAVVAPITMAMPHLRESLVMGAAASAEVEFTKIVSLMIDTPVGNCDR